MLEFVVFVVVLVAALSVVDVNVDTCTGSVVDNMFVVDFVVVVVCVVVVEGSVVPDVVLTKLVVVDDPLIVGAVRVAELGSLLREQKWQ